VSLAVRACSSQDGALPAAHEEAQQAGIREAEEDSQVGVQDTTGAETPVRGDREATGD
jgi:hypothetical protein